MLYKRQLNYCRENRIRLLGLKLGEPFKDNDKNKEKIRELKRIEREDESTRNAIEGKFGEGKRRYPLHKIGIKLKETSEESIMMVFLMMNFMVLVREKEEAFLCRLLIPLTK